jgi:uncharacterized membrane protein YphA (DoxX/SURF4 family)
MLLPWWPASFPDVSICAYIIGAVLIIGGAMIILNIKGRAVSIGLGVLFFLLFLCFHVYYQLFLNPHGFQLAFWINPLKELAFSGGALIIAAGFPKEKSSDKFLLITGRVFFSVMLIVFGISHFVYKEFVALLVPGWIPWHMFWTYFGAVALIGAGVCILLKIKITLVSMLAGIMLLLWLIILHIPRAIAAPNSDQGNETTSVFQALAFSGIAFVIAGIYKKRSG